jgi:cell wall assembly regulator SMI1
VARSCSYHGGMDASADWPFRAVKPTWPGATSAEVESVEAGLAVSFPDDYRAFLQWSNGWEGWLGEAYLALHPTSDLPWGQ